MRPLLIIPLVFCLHPGLAKADQFDSRLPQWFDELASTRATTAPQVQQQIWQAWYTVPQGGSQTAFDEARLALNAGQYVRARSGFEGFAELHPEFAEVFNQLAIVYFVLGEDAASIDAIFRTIELEPNHFGAWAGLAQIWFRNQDFDGAVEAADRALAINPTMSSIRQLKAAAQAELEKESV